MSPVNFIQPSFAAGEISPQLYARVDLAKYHIAAKLLRNFFVWPQGGVSNRAGTMFVGRCRDSANNVHLIPFQFNLVQAYVLEFGHRYMRVIMDGGYVLEPAVAISGVTNADPGVVTTGALHGYGNGDQVFVAGTGTDLDSTPGRQYLVANATSTAFTLTDLDGNAIDTTNYGAYGGSGGTVARVFTLTTPYAGSDVADIKWTQSNDVLTLCHSSYPPMDLSRTEHWVWTLEEISFAPKISPPTGLTFTNGGSGSGWNFQYVVTALSDSPPEESVASEVIGGSGPQLNSNTGVSNTISWQAVTAAKRYYVYKANPSTKAIPDGVMFGYIGQTTGTSFEDLEIGPDFSQAPPQGTNPFNAGPIATVTILDGGSNYDADVTMYASDLTGSDAVLTPTISDGLASAVSVTSGGSGYSTAAGLETTGGTGSGLTVDITDSSGAIGTAAINNPGSGYSAGDVVTVVQTGGSGGTLTIGSIKDGVITAVTIEDGGQNYQNPKIGVANAGTGAVGRINVHTQDMGSLGSITTITATITAGGQNYFGDVTVAPTSGGSGCTFEPVITNGVITKVKVGGVPSGYKDGDPLVFTQKGGSGASFSASTDASGSYPSCCAYFQQRKVFAGSLNSPQTIWMTQPADYHNMDVSNPSKDSDAIIMTIAAQQVNAIKHLVPMNDLLIFTSGGIWRILTGYVTQPQAVTPSNTVVIPQTYIGAADLPPIVVNYDILYVQSKGSIVRDLAYNFWMNVYTGTDMSVLANHLFFGHNMTRWAYAEQPWYQIWTVRDDGALLSFTYLKEQNVYAWAHHDSPGNSGNDLFLSVASIPEQQVAGINVDSVYFVVERTIPGVNGGAPVKYVERMNSRNMLVGGVSDVTQAWFLDCALQYSGDPTTEISGLDHLEGANVSILADGNVQPRQTVVDGSITLQYPASIVTVGLSYTAQMRTLCMQPEQMSMQVQDYRKRISAVAVRVADTRGLKVGPNFDDLVEIKERGATVEMGQAIPLFTGDERVVIDSQYLVEDDVCIQQDNPLPCTILGVIPEVSIGDGPG